MLAQASVLSVIGAARRRERREGGSPWSDWNGLGPREAAPVLVVNERVVQPTLAKKASSPVRPQPEASPQQFSSRMSVQ